MGKWITCTIGEIGTVVGGGTPLSSEESYYGGDIPWITPKDLSGYRKRCIGRGERNITTQGYKNSSTIILPKGSVLFSSRAPIGYVAIADTNLCTNQGFKSIIPNEKIDSTFLYYLLKYKSKDIAAQGSGTTFMEISGSAMKEIIIKIPEDIEEQRHIASILSLIDDKIELNDAINDYLTA